MLYFFFEKVSVGKSWVNLVVDGKAYLQGLLP